MGSIPSGISASRGAAILGMCKYSEPIEVWCKIQEERCLGFCEANMYPKPEFIDSAATRWGNALEDKICEFAERHCDTGISIIGREKLSVHSEHDFMTCHQDGEYYMPRPWHILHEGKTANERTYRNDWGTPGTDQIPSGYMVQVQQQMAITGANECIVSVLVLPMMQTELPHIGKTPLDGFDEDLEWSPISQTQIDLIADGLYAMGYFHQYPVKRNQKLIDIMLEKYVTFWQENVLKKIPPKPESMEWIKKLIPEPCGTIIANEQVERWSTERASLKKEMKSAKKRIDDLSKFLLNYMLEQSKLDGLCIDDASTKKILLLAGNGFKLHSYNGKQFR